MARGLRNKLLPLLENRIFVAEGFRWEIGDILVFSQDQYGAGPMMARPFRFYCSAREAKLVTNFRV